MGTHRHAIAKTDGLKTDVFSNYRPVSNPNTISKIVERVYLATLLAHVKQSPKFQQILIRLQVQIQL